MKNSQKQTGLEVLSDMVSHLPGSNEKKSPSSMTRFYPYRDIAHILTLPKEMEREDVQLPAILQTVTVTEEIQGLLAADDLHSRLGEKQKVICINPKDCISIAETLQTNFKKGSYPHTIVDIVRSRAIETRIDGEIICSFTDCDLKPSQITKETLERLPSLPSTPTNRFQQTPGAD